MGNIRRDPARTRRWEEGSIMDSTSSLLWGILFGSIGFGYFIYGKKQQRGMPMLSGIALMVFPYVVSNSVVMVLIGALLIALPFFVNF